MSSKELSIVQYLDRTSDAVDMSVSDLKSLVRYDIYDVFNSLEKKLYDDKRWFIELYLDSIFKVNSVKVSEILKTEFFKDFFERGTFQGYLIEKTGKTERKIFYLLKRPSFYRIPIEYFLKKLDEINSDFISVFRNNYLKKEFDLYTFFIPNIKESLLFLNYASFIFSYITCDVSLIDSFKDESILRKHIFVSYSILEKYLQFKRLDISYFIQESFISGKSIYIVFSNSQEFQNFNNYLSSRNGNIDDKNKKSSKQRPDSFQGNQNEELDKIFFGDKE